MFNIFSHKNTIMTKYQHYVKKPAEVFEIQKPGFYEFFIVEPLASIKVTGIFQAHRAENIEVTVILHHQAPHTQAETILKGAAFDRSRISFTGRIIIDAECGDSNSFLTERILLLSDEAKAETIPDLEILTDDVKCSHAATISRIPEDQIFYLMSRGLSREKAEQEVVRGFLDE